MEFSESERVLLCGSPKSDAWLEIPRTQVRYHLESFLTERGYFDPKIETLPDGTIRVVPGPTGRIDELKFEGWPEDVEAVPEAIFLGRRLDSARLDELEEMALTRLRSSGYACPEVESLAEARKGLVRVRVRAGSKHRFGEIERQPVDGFDPALLQRYEPFTPKEFFDPRLLTLAERRVRTKGVVQDVVYAPLCEANGKFRISQHTFLGRSRFLSLGAGFDTEEWFLARARFSAQRLTEKAASLDTLALASFKTQSLEVNFEAPYGETLERQSFASVAQFKRSDTPSYEALALTARNGYRRRFETLQATNELGFGLLTEKVWIRRGTGPDEGHLVALEAMLSRLSHLFEYYADAPRDGSRLEFTARLSSERLGSSFTALTLTARGEVIRNIADFGAASLVWGQRAAVSVNLASNAETEIPLAYRHYLGGSRDLRGFSRQELPRTKNGAQNTAFLGSELRVTRFSSLEPLLFVDLGTVDAFVSKPDLPLYLSPGTGLRYRFPFGTLRGTVAHGFTLVERPEDVGQDHWEFFVSFGEEF